MGAASHPSPLRGIAWGALAALLVGVLPYAWVLRAVRQRRFSTAAILVIVFGPALLATGVLVVATGWFRVHLRDHTLLQVILGAVVATTVYLPLQ